MWNAALLKGFVTKGLTVPADMSHYFIPESAPGSLIHFSCKEELGCRYFFAIVRGLPNSHASIRESESGANRLVLLATGRPRVTSIQCLVLCFTMGFSDFRNGLNVCF